MEKEVAKSKDLLETWKQQVNKLPARMFCIDCNYNCFTFCDDGICMICQGRLVKMS